MVKKEIDDNIQQRARSLLSKLDKEELDLIARYIFDYIDGCWPLRDGISLEDEIQRIYLRDYPIIVQRPISLGTETVKMFIDLEKGLKEEIERIADRLGFREFEVKINGEHIDQDKIDNEYELTPEDDLLMQPINNVD